MTGKRIAALIVSTIIGLIAVIIFFSTNSDVTVCHNAFVAATAPTACNQDNAVHYISLVVFMACTAGVIWAWAGRKKEG